MDTNVAKDMLRIIRAERDRRARERRAIDDPDYEYHHWLFTDGPFINELCLVLLVAIRHHLERKLVFVAARLTNDGRELGGDEYSQRVRDERASLRAADGWKSLAEKLQLGKLADWEHSMKILQLLANTYKHDPSITPDEKFLARLHLPLDVNYNTLAESQAFRAALAVDLGLDADADYCDIAETLLARVERFVLDVQAQLILSPVLWGAVSMKREDFLH